MNVKLTRAQKIKILNSVDVFNIMQQILLRENKIARNKEHFWIICLANNNRILMIELISLGSVNATIVEPMDVFSFALQKRAVSIIMVHNHPSGELNPSKEDIELTEIMLSIGKFIRVPVVDHLIISEKEYYSMEDEGIIKKMNDEERFDLTFKKADKLKLEIENLQKKNAIGLAKKMTDMAKKMLKDKQSVKKIAEYTGLTVKEIEKLKGKK